MTTNKDNPEHELNCTIDNSDLTVYTREGTFHYEEPLSPIEAQTVFYDNIGKGLCQLLVIAMLILVGVIIVLVIEKGIW